MPELTANRRFQKVCLLFLAVYQLFTLRSIDKLLVWSMTQFGVQLRYLTVSALIEGGMQKTVLLVKLLYEAHYVPVRICYIYNNQMRN